MIKQLALLTQIQAEQINNIETAIDSARDYVAQGEVKLVSAKTYYKKSQKVYFLLKIRKCVVSS